MQLDPGGRDLSTCARRSPAEEATRLSRFGIIKNKHANMQTDLRPTIALSGRLTILLDLHRRSSSREISSFPLPGIARASRDCPNFSCFGSGTPSNCHFLLHGAVPWQFDELACPNALVPWFDPLHFSALTSIPRHVCLSLPGLSCIPRWCHYSGICE
jgi:hypothetical protein